MTFRAGSWFGPNSCELAATLTRLLPADSAVRRQAAAMSTRGSARVVAMSRHNIQVDQSQAVIDAVAGVLDALKTP